MNEMHKLKDMLCDELDKITKKGELSAGSLDAIDKLTHSIKSIETIMAMEGYSKDTPYSYRRSRDDYRTYSRDDKRRLKEELEMLMSENPDHRHLIQKWMNQID